MHFVDVLHLVEKISEKPCGLLFVLLFVNIIIKTIVLVYFVVCCHNKCFLVS